jgi:DNA-binding response OmpR family regulator
MSQTAAPPLVLVADDEPQMLELVALHLKSLEEPRVDVIQASDGEEAWRLAREHLPDLVVLDVMMPGMSGWEVCRKIREDVALAHTGVVMLTGIGENLNQMTSPLYGADAYIDKPFEFGELADKVRQALEARATQREAVTRPVRNGVGGPARAAVSSQDAVQDEGRGKAKRRGAKKRSVKGKATMAAKKATAKKTAAKKTTAKKAARKAARKAPAAKKTARKGAARKAPAAKKTARKGARKAPAAKKTARKAASKRPTAAKKGARKGAKRAAKKAAATEE